MSLQRSDAASPGETEPKPAPRGDIDAVAINTIRTLAVDAVQKADSGHAGAPMGMAAVGYTLWRRFLRYDPDAPLWPNRDRFVLSAGHGSMLLYALLFLSGVKAGDAEGRAQNRPAVGLDDIKQFRELGSRCPGHPEFGVTTGVETTTGPLGQGVGDSVGMAIAERWLEARYNRPGHQLFDYDVYALCSDGDLMEGVSGEAASLAGHLKLANLCWIYDDNQVSIEGSTELAFTEDVTRRFEGYGWATRTLEDANDCEGFAAALEAFRSQSDRPMLIRVKSIIGFGSPHRQGTSKIHSDPLGEEEVRLTKRAYGWPEDAQFLVPDGVRARMDEGIGARGRSLRGAWEAALQRYGEAFPGQAAELRRIWSGELPDGWDEALPSFPADAKGLATREASGKVLGAVGPAIPWLVGGSADLAPSTKTHLDFADAGDFAAGAYRGRNLRFGVREHVMGACANGLALSGLRPYVGTFLVFSDYMRPPIRLAALMELPAVFVFTHDSIGLGQDGPTHQPIEHLASLRAIPGLTVIRPCDANETVAAWRIALERRRPTCLVLSRQALPTLDRTRYAPADGLARGAYVLADPQGGGAPQVILIASGSEVSLCLAAQDQLAAAGVRARVVSMASFELFEAQPRSYRESVLPSQITARVAVEAAAPLGWDRYAGAGGEIIAMRSFGASAPIKDVMTHFGFTADHVRQAALAQLGAATEARP
ncbi:MAG TPA: transketolase [Caulobacteraceae bacterium]|nr:transketolase [Caulobacteraceae bacterium]